MKYDVIVMDPPWGWKDNLKMSDIKRGAESNYNTMSVDRILDIPIQDITSTDGALLALWVPSSMLDIGLTAMKKYGFNYKQTWIWVKIKKDPFKSKKKSNNINFEQFDFNSILSFGMGRLARNVHEICLIGVKGKIYNKLKNKSQRTVFFYQNEKHSKKPEILQDRLEIMFGDDVKYLEVFGRRLRKNWEVIGNQSDSCIGEDIYDSIDRLKRCNNLE